MTGERLTKGDIIEAVGRRIYNRGLNYVAADTHLRDVAPNRGRAVVVGTHAYVASFEFVDGVFSGRCTCPASKNQYACKHVAATAVAYIDDPAPRADTNIVATFVEAMSREDLIATVMGQTVDNPPFFASLLKGAVLNGASLAMSPNSLRSAVKDALDAALGGGDDPDSPLKEAVRMLRSNLTLEMAPFVADFAFAAIERIDPHGTLSRYGDDHDRRSRRRWDHDDDDFEEEVEIDEAEDFVRVHAEAEKLCGASPGYVADRVSEMVAGSDFARARADIYAGIFGEEIRSRILAMPW